MNTMIALPDGRLVLDLHGVAHTVTSVEHDVTFTVTSCKVDPPSQEIADLISSNIATHRSLSMMALEQALKRLDKPNKA